MKNWYQSKTIAFQILTAISAGLVAFQQSNPNIAWVGIAVTLINVVLRFKTDTPIAPIS